MATSTNLPGELQDVRDRLQAVLDMDGETPAEFILINGFRSGLSGPSQHWAVPAPPIY